jgi:hypothetical protein
LPSFGRGLGDCAITCAREAHVLLIFERSIKQLLDVDELCVVFVNYMKVNGRRRRQWFISSIL